MASSIKWIHQLIQMNSPIVNDKYVFINQGDELYANPDILNVFTNHHYEVYPTGTNISHQNGHVEHSHQTIGDHVPAFLIDSSLVIKFWSNAFLHHICISNAMAMNGQNSFQIFQATGKWIRLPNKKTYV